MASPSEQVDTFATLPDPGHAGTFDDLVEKLRLLKVWAGDPSYERITDRIRAAWSVAGRPSAEAARKNTVADCFKTGRRRMNTDLVIAVVQALHPDVGYAAQWRQALRVIGGETQAASQVRVHDTLPQDPPEFTGRAAEMDQLRRALRLGDGEAAVVSAIEGMAGVGKTQLAVHTGHLLLREQPFDRVMFVNLRGFDPDPAQPPADPAAVLDGFLRLLGVPGQQIPHDLPARSAAFRSRLAGTRALLVLDNAADAEQVRPLLPATPGCLALVTSRRSLADLHPAIHLAVEVFTAEEAVAFLGRAVPGIPVGADPGAMARIAQRCGHLPLALGLVAGHIRSTPDWTLTDHADRLDERHRDRRLHAGVELALNLSYQHLPTDQQRLLRRMALHPGQDFDAYAAAALTDTDLPTAQDHLDHLCRDHLLQQATAGRYSFHDLVCAYAAERAGDEDPPPHRRTALTRLLDFYAATTAAAMDVAYPYERERRPKVSPAGTPTPGLADRSRADQWLDAELANLLTIAHHAAEHGWPEYTWQLSALLHSPLRTRGRYRDAETLHQHALHLAHDLGNLPAETNCLNNLGQANMWLGRFEQARDHHEQALQIAEDVGDRAGVRAALTGLGSVHWMLGRYEQAAEHHERAIRIAQDIGDRPGELQTLHALGGVHYMQGRYEQGADCEQRALQIAKEIGDRVGEQTMINSLGNIDLKLCRYEQAAGNFGRALQLARDVGDRRGELYALNSLGRTHWRQRHYEQAGDYFSRALRIAQEIGDRLGEMTTITSLGHIHRMLGRHDQAADSYHRVFEVARALDSRNWQFEALQGLGRLHHATGNTDLALANHEQALRHATDLNQLGDQARAHDGLAHAHHALGHHEQARLHWQQALDILITLGTDHSEDIEATVASIRAHLTDLADLTNQ